MILAGLASPLLCEPDRDWGFFTVGMLAWWTIKSTVIYEAMLPKTGTAPLHCQPEMQGSALAPRCEESVVVSCSSAASCENALRYACLL